MNADCVSQSIQGVISEQDLVNELMQSDTRINAAAQKEARAYMRDRTTNSTAAPTSTVTATTKSATLRGHNHVSRCAFAVNKLL